MTTIDITEATSSLADYAKLVKKQRILITQNGKPIAALVSPSDIDSESISLSTNPRFLSLLERSRESLRREGGIPLQQVREELATYNARKKSKKRKRVA